MHLSIFLLQAFHFIPRAPYANLCEASLPNGTVLLGHALVRNAFASLVIMKE